MQSRGQYRKLVPLFAKRLERFPIAACHVICPGKIGVAPGRAIRVMFETGARPCNSLVRKAGVGQDPRQFVSGERVIRREVDCLAGLRDRPRKVVVVPLVEESHQPVPKPGFEPRGRRRGNSLGCEAPCMIDVRTGSLRQPRTSPSRHKSMPTPGAAKWIPDSGKAPPGTLRAPEERPGAWSASTTIGL